MLVVVFMYSMTTIRASAGTVGVITEDTTLIEDIEIASTSSGSYMTIGDGDGTTTVTIDGVRVHGGGLVETLFEVKANSTLIINDLTIDNISTTNTFKNYGTLIINKLVLNNSSTYDIWNSTADNVTTSSKPDYLLLGDTNIDSIYIDSGYVSVSEKTKVNLSTGEKIHLTLSDSKKTTLPTAVVRGNSECYASYYIDKFSFTKYEDEVSGVNYWVDLDYVGALDNVKSGKETTLDTKGYKTGDIILTTTSIDFRGDDNILPSDTEVILGGRYATARSYYLNSITNTWSYQSALYDKLVVADNYNMLATNSSGGISTFARCSLTTASVVVKNNGETIKSQTITYGVGGYWLTFIDIPEGASFSSDNISTKSGEVVYTIVYSNSNHVALLLKPDASGDTITISFSRSIELNSVEAILENDTFEYDGRDHYSEVKAYYMSGETKVYLELVNTSIINAGEYLLEVNSDNIYISNVNELVVTVTKKELTITYSQSENSYTGESITVTPSVIGVCGDDDVSIDYTNTSKINAGNYVVTASLKDTTANANYIIAEESQSYNFIITKAVVDMSGVTYTYGTNNEMEYVGGLVELKVSGLDRSLVNVQYVYPEETIFNVREEPYIYTANFSLVDTINYEALDVTTLTLALKIIPKKIDVSDIDIEDKDVVYSGSEYSLDLPDLPDMVEFIPVGDFTQANAGSHTISYTLSIEDGNANYELVGRENYTLSAVLDIDRAEFDLTGVSFEAKTVTYDKTPHNCDLVGSLPIGLVIADRLLSDRVNAGEYDQEIVFGYDMANDVYKDNYILPDNLVARLTISRRVISVELLESTKVYTGEALTFEHRLIGVLDGDIVSIDITNNVKTDASSYSAEVDHDSISNSNYTTNTDILNFTITKANIDMSSVSIYSADIEYFGGEYTPRLVGSLPDYVSYELLHGTIKSVGKYTVIAKFTTSNPNYNKPTDIVGEVKITPRTVVVCFDNHIGLMYNGETQFIDVSISGMVDNEAYTITYSSESRVEGASSEPREAGPYKCEVTLSEKSNYVIAGDSICYFEIYTNTREINNDDFRMVVSDGIFSAEGDLSVNSLKLSNYLDNEIKIKHDKAEKIKSFRIESDYNEEPINVSIEIKDMELKSTRGVTVYRINSSGDLEEIKYTILDGALNFEIDNSSSIVVVKDEVDNSVMILLIIIAVLFAGALSMTIIHIITKKRKKK